MTDRFQAFRIEQQDGEYEVRLRELCLADIDPGAVVVRVRYSSVNYKDALALTGKGRIIRRFPCVAGVDAAGVVAHSTDPRFKAGDEVLVTGYELGVAHDGGYAGYLRVPAEWVVPLPAGLSLFEAMALGTAGFTAALALYRLEQNELTPDKGKVVVTGATGGVGSLALQMLARRGYRTVAVTGKDAEHEYLRMLGASEILTRASIELEGKKALEPGQWAGALDAVGGAMLGWLTRTMQQEGVIASYGNAGGAELHTTVFPFILRGVKLLGVDSAATTMPLRRELWQRLAGEWRPARLAEMTRTIALQELPEACAAMVEGKGQGRVVVTL